MSTSRGNGGGNGVQPIPAASRKMVQSLKEVVNCSEAEIYATLKDCNMDPNEAVNRLLSQDHFHEVKKKREKKKEGTDSNESRPRGANNTNRGGKSGADRHLGRGGSTSFYSSEPVSMHGKSSDKKENKATPYTSSLPSAPSLSGNNRSRGTAGLSDDTSAENKGPSWGMADGMPSGIQPPSISHSSWVVTPGQVSMAEIVKMGRPHNNSVNAPNGSHNNVQGPSTTTVSNKPKFPDYRASKDEWPAIEKPVAPIVMSAPESIVDSHVHPEESVVHFDSENQYSESEKDQETLDDDIETTAVHDVGTHSISSRKLPDDDSRGGSLHENHLYKNMGSYLPQPQAHDFERHEVEEAGTSVSSATRHLEQLSVEKDDRDLTSEGDAPSVIIPDHLQVQSADCSHLSFGSFGSGMSIPYSSGVATSLPIETNSEHRLTEVDVPSVGHADIRDSEYYGEDSFRNDADGSIYHRNGASSERYDTSSASQPEQLKSESAEVQYPFPSSNHPGYSYDNAQLLNASFSQTNTEMQNQPPFSNVMSYPSSLFASNAQPSRESELQHSPFSIAPSMAAKYGISASAHGGSAISMSEALKAAGMSSMQPALQNLSGASVAPGGQPLPQHLAMHPYSQPALPLGPFASMIGYPLMPQSYAYMPSAFQHSLANNSSYHQSLAALLPQYKNSVSASSVSHSAAIASGYGGHGNTGTISGNFQMNPPAAALSGSGLSYDDLLNSQYKDNSHLISLPQNENSSMWPHAHGANSRTMSAVPPGTYYNYQGQGQQQQQQPGGFRQTRQISPNYGPLGYPTSAQQDQPTSGSQGQQPTQSQIWRNGY